MNPDEKDAAYIYIGLSFTIIFYMVCFIFIFIGKLFLLHMWLALQNLTFYEHIRHKWSGLPWKNPFDRKSSFKNFKFLICRRVPKAFLELYKRKAKYMDLYNIQIL